jgi:hypothetical protein
MSEVECNVARAGMPTPIRQLTNAGRDKCTLILLGLNKFNPQSVLFLPNSHHGSTKLWVSSLQKIPPLFS